jgi:hypothetical protein
MQWIIDNWLTVVLIVGMLAMHMFGHGHGGHGGHGRRRKDEGETDHPDAADKAKDEERIG